MNQTMGQLLELLAISMDTKDNIEITNEVDWERMNHLAQQHNILPMLYEGITKANLENQMDLVMLEKLKIYARTKCVTQLQRTMQFLNIYDQLNQEGIEAILVKGATLRMLYPNPYYRESGDEDIYIKKADYERVDTILQNNGFLYYKSKRASGKLLQEISYEHGSGLSIDVHIDLFDSGIQVYEKMNDLFKHAFEDSMVIQIEGIKVKTLSYDMHILFLILHSLKHFVNNGFGIRQVCDIVMYCNHYGNTINWDLVWNQIKTAKCEEYVFNLFDIGILYLGLKKEKVTMMSTLSLHAHSKSLLIDIMHAGIFGKSDPDQTKSSSLTFQALVQDRKETNRKKSNINLIRMVFPNRECMARGYDYCEKSPLLIPVAWMHRLLNYVLRARKQGRNVWKHANRSFMIGKQRVQLLREYGIIGDHYG